MLGKKTYMARKGEVERKWYLVDAKDKTLGRLACQIAVLLMGKHKPQYTPHVDCGDFVVVINADKVKLTGAKWEKKMYYWHSGYLGGLKARTAKQVLERKPEYLIHHAVKGMLPKNNLAKRMLKKLKVYAGGTHPHEAQKPEPIEITGC
ncbi:large subunit ribosomal protein L13 [Thermosulfidibacter takaii ABI70S6]|uniref:Large ribosomal subunit protein uL13 n=1 Tax=Thermosulfidibacter takaii (strain DSM 17441 / JCM 13301 / NBRC 103674 / ABI70S6) TaxID=1298851 RepID=A0A0S3QRK8_THET7|nr:50S ribosomal protein L13 [Thermosulfidibacter takaii]BAT70975.1 large subunit ribosomal protein L13 [Thermosulfidibacter takaii ABI70S6]